MYKLCEAIVFIFLGYYAAFALQMNAIGGIPSDSQDAVYLARSLVDHRAGFIVCLASLYVFLRVTKRQVHTNGYDFRSARLGDVSGRHPRSGQRIFCSGVNTRKNHSVHETTFHSGPHVHGR